MNKKILAAAVLAVVSGSAMAANAELYGILDISITSTSNVDSSNRNQTAMQDGVWLPSLFGIKGSEDLGDGMSAFFDLQSNLTSTNGQAGTPATGSTQLFNRSSTVGISGEFGKISAGERLDPIWLQSIAEQAMGVHHSGSAALMSLSYQGPTAIYGTSTVGPVMSANWLAWDVPKFIDNVNLTAAYQFGNQAGTTSGSSGYYIGGTYSKSGLTVNFGNEAQNNSSNTARLNRTLVGASYSVGDFTVEGQEMRISTSGATVGTFNAPSGSLLTGKIDAQAGQFGVAYNLNPKLKVGAQYAWINDNINNARPGMTSLSAVYSLSKRTSVYTQIENQTPSGNIAGYGTGYTANSSSTNSNASMVAFGMFHIF